MTTARLSNHVAAGENSFGVVRLLAALAVVLSHAWGVAYGEAPPEPLETATGYTIGAHAVHIFFFLSGLLIAASLERASSLVSFTMARVARIMPALFAVTVLTILAGGAFLTTAPETYWDGAALGGFFLKNMLFLGGNASLPGVFEGLPYPDTVNLPLWTLKYEILCYGSLVAGLLLVRLMLPKGNERMGMLGFAIVVLIAASAFHVQAPAYDDSTTLDHLARMAFAFYLGSVFWHLRHRVILSLPFAFALLFFAAAATAIGTPFVEQLQILAVGYAVLAFARHRIAVLSAFANRQDYSYGVYIMAFPIQQALVAFYGPMNPVLNFAVAAVLAVGLAALSWNVIERPALRWQKRADPWMARFCDKLPIPGFFIRPMLPVATRT